MVCEVYYSSELWRSAERQPLGFTEKQLNIKIRETCVLSNENLKGRYCYNKVKLVIVLKIVAEKMSYAISFIYKY